jgi:hypothetical protein
MSLNFYSSQIYQKLFSLLSPFHKLWATLSIHCIKETFHPLTSTSQIGDIQGAEKGDAELRQQAAKVMTHARKKFLRVCTTFGSLL